MFTIHVSYETSVVIPEILILKISFINLKECFFFSLFQVLLPESKAFCPKNVDWEGCRPLDPPALYIFEQTWKLSLSE